MGIFMETGPHRSLRVAILDCDYVPESLQQVYGRCYSSMFIARLQQAALRSRSSRKIDFSTWDVIEGQYPDPDIIDAIIITGSVAAAYSQDAWILKLGRFIQQVYQHHPQIRLFGTCMGHQLISHVLLKEHGGFAEKNPRGTQMGIRSVELDPQFSSHFSKVRPDLRQLRIQVIHGDHVNMTSGKLPQGWMMIGRTECCDIHGFFQPNRVLTFQGHFEMSAEACRDIVTSVSLKPGEIMSEALQANLAKMQGADDAEIYADIILSFLSGDPAEESSDVVEKVVDAIEARDRVISSIDARDRVIGSSMGMEEITVY